MALNIIILSTLFNLFNGSWIASWYISVNHNSKKLFLNKVCNLNLPFPFVITSLSLNIIVSFIYLILMCYFYHIGEYHLFSIMTPHMLTERQLIRGVNVACYFRVFMLRNLVFSLPCNVATQSHVLPCPQFVLYSDDGTITLSYRGRVSNVSCLCPELSIKTSGKKNQIVFNIQFSI